MIAAQRSVRSLSQGSAPCQHHGTQYDYQRQQRQARHRPLPQIAVGSLDSLAPAAGCAHRRFANHHQISFRHAAAGGDPSATAQQPAPRLSEPATTPPRAPRVRSPEAEFRSRLSDRAPTELPRPQKPRRAKANISGGRRRRQNSRRRGSHQTAQEVEHQQCASGRRHGRERADDAVAELSLHRELRQRAAGKGQPAEARAPAPRPGSAPATGAGRRWRPRRSRGTDPPLTST